MTTISAARAGIPRSVPLSPAAHEELITQLVHHRAAAREAGAGDLYAQHLARARIVRNDLVEAYREYIIRANRKAAANAAAADEQLGEAFIGCIEAIDAYDPASGVPLSAWLASRHAITGEKVRQAGSVLTVGTPNQRRQNVADGNVQYPASFETPTVTGTLGDELIDTAALPEQIVEARALVTDIRSVVDRFPRVQADTLSAYYGLAGQTPRSLRAIAESEGVGVQAVWNRIGRAHQSIAAMYPDLAAHLAA